MNHIHVTIAFRQKGTVSIQDLENVIEELNSKATSAGCVDSDVFFDFSSISMIQQRWENSAACHSYLENVSVDFLQFMDLVEVQKFDIMGDNAGIEELKSLNILQTFAVNYSTLT
jgi:hypothetical protein